MLYGRPGSRSVDWRRHRHPIIPNFDLAHMVILHLSVGSAMPGCAFQFAIDVQPSLPRRLFCPTPDCIFACYLFVARQPTSLPRYAA